MWECDACGCLGIAADLGICPMCVKERIVPKATSGGASNGWEQPDGDVFEMSAEWEPEVAAAGAEEQPAEAPVEVVADPAAAADVVVGEPGPEVVDAAPADAPVAASTRSKKLQP